MIKTALVTGGAGFIGSHMVDFLLSKNYIVKVLDNFSGGQEQNLVHHKNNDKLIIEKTDIRDCEKIKTFFNDINEVYHFAGIGDIVPSIENPIEYFSVNASGTAILMDCLRNSKNLKKIVYAASSSCYGLASTPTDEHHKIQPEYPYALSKYQGEMIVRHWYKVYKIPVNTIRIFNAYGPRVRTTGAYGAVFGVFFKQKLSDAPFTIVGDGEQTRDFLYVTDVAKAFFMAAQTKLTNEVWNLGAGNPVSINYLADLIGYKSKKYIPKRPAEPDCTWANIKKISKDLNWKAEVNFEEGVRTMLKDINYWQDAPLWTEKKIQTATKTWFKYLKN